MVQIITIFCQKIFVFRRYGYDAIENSFYITVNSIAMNLHLKENQFAQNIICSRHFERNHSILVFSVSKCSFSFT